MPRTHYAVEHQTEPLCREPRWYAADTNKDNVTCRRCLYLLGMYMPTDPERREELTKRQNELDQPKCPDCSDYGLVRGGTESTVEPCGHESHAPPAVVELFHALKEALATKRK